MSTPEAQVHQPPFPTRSVFLGLLTMFMLITASLAVNWKVGEGIRQTVTSQGEVVTGAQRALDYGLILQMSVRAATVGRDPEAAAYYNLYRSELRSILADLGQRLAPANVASDAIEDVQRANLQLAAREFQALELARAERFEDARRLLASEDYNRDFQRLQEGMRAVERSAHGYVHLFEAKLERYLLWTALLSASSLAIVLVGWFTIFRPARRWGEQLDLARKSAEVAASQLREKQDELEDLNRQLFRQARVDPLTELNTRLSFNEDAKAIWTAVDPSPNIIFAVMCDVDYFKQFNDSCGHLAGDRALRLIADSLRTAVGPGDQAYRLGGEEFLVVMQAASPRAAAARADRLRQAVLDLQIDHPASPLGVVTISMGVAPLSRQSGMTVEQWLRDADTALYEAKTAGRNRVQVKGRTAIRLVAESPEGSARVNCAAAGGDS